MQSVLGPQVLTGGRSVELREGRLPGFISPTVGVLFSGSSQLIADNNPHVGTLRVGGKGSIPAPKSLLDPGVSRSGLTRSVSGQQQGFPVLDLTV